MYEVQKFALNNIYCAPSQDRQYRFKLVRVTKPHSPLKRNFSVYNRLRPLPNTRSAFHVYVIGNLPVGVLNLLQKQRNWVRDQWRNFAEDMMERNFIMQLYDMDGIVFPRKNVYYSAGNNELLIAVEIDNVISSMFDIEKCAYMRLYSNHYFNTQQFGNDGDQRGIVCGSGIVRNNLEKVAMQNQIAFLEQQGGKTLVYVNGFFTDKMDLNVPNNSFVEYVYDRSILTREVLRIGDMRTFHSEKDDRVKYLMYRDRSVSHLQFEDDLELYIVTKDTHIKRGLYYYQHKHYALTNVTDKDFALDSQFVNNQAQVLNGIINSPLGDKEIILFTRRSAVERELVYSSLKLHELYKLPADKQLDVISNVGYMLPEFRVERLENSSYFKIASAPALSTITKELATDAVGYNGVNYYFGYTPNKVPSSGNNQVPLLYRTPSTVYEYDAEGLMIGHYTTTGPMYPINNPEAKYVEYIRGRNLEVFDLFDAGETTGLDVGEYRVIAALYDGHKRISTWTDVTEHEAVKVVDGNVTMDDPSLGKFRVIYLDDIVTQDLELPLNSGVLIFPIEVLDDHGDGEILRRLDVPFDNIEVFLNGHRLTYNIDFRVNFPNVVICNKTYIDYTKEKQQVHLRMTGYNLDPQKINQREINGFVSHGVLTRNNYYDLRDDRVFSTFVKGRLVPREYVRFSEDDNSVRIRHPYNGVPYTVNEHMRSIQEVTGLPTLPQYHRNEQSNSRISELYNIIFPEPEVDKFNVIGDHHYLYSSLVSKVIHDVLSGALSASIYTTPYNDATILDLINTRYKTYYDLDPIKLDLPDNIVEIHPHIGNTVVEVNLYQYRFILNLIRLITNGKPTRINLSGYLAVNGDLSESEIPSKPMPVAVLVV